MPRSGAVAILLLLSLLPFPDSRAEEMINPHVKPEVCDACHIKVPTADDGERGDYFLAKETIDATCQVCHEYSCCKRGALGQFNHPSNISRWDWSKFRRPRVLPLYGGASPARPATFPMLPKNRRTGWSGSSTSRGKRSTGRTFATTATSITDPNAPLGPQGHIIIIREESGVDR